MSKCSYLCLRWVFLTALTTALGWSQSANTADLVGLVRDSAGGAISQVEISVANQDTGLARKTSTQDTGFYRMPSLPAGRYSIRATRQGFADAVQGDVVLTIGAVGTVNLTLAVASQAQSVSVSSGAPMVEAERASVGTVVNRLEIDDLPINGRNFLDFAATVNGVTPQQTSGQGSGLSFNGGRGRSNSIVVDGVDNNGQLNGNVRLTLSQKQCASFR